MSTNYRVRSSYPPIPTMFYSIVNGVPGPVSRFDSWTSFAQFGDYINPTDKRTGRRPVNGCDHTKVRVKIGIPDLVYSDGGPPYTQVGRALADLAGMRPYNSVLNYSGFSGWINLIQPFGSTAQFSSLCLSALKKQVTQIPSKISVVNSIIELKDFRPLLNRLKDVPKLLKEGGLPKALSQPTKNIRKVPKKVAAAANDTFLQWNFAWAPFISDLQALTSLVDTVTNRLNYLRKIQGKDTTVHFEVKDCFLHPLVGTVIYTYADSADLYARVVLTSYKCDFNSTWRLLENLQGLDDAWSGLKSTLAALGVNNPLQIAWNAIPFSFLLDWVAPFSKWLTLAAVQPFQGQWNVSEVTTSYHETLTFDFIWTAKKGGTDGSMTTVTVDRYVRVPGLPLSLGAFDFSQLTDTQQKLALSIPLTRVLK